MFKYELGQGVKDIVSGFCGVVTARIEYLTGCGQYALSPTKLSKEGKCKTLFGWTRIG